MAKKIKKICCCVLSRANYGSIKSLMEKIKADKKFQLQLVVGSSALIDKQGKCIELIKNDGFKVDEEVNMNMSDDSPGAMAQIVGLGLLKFPEIFTKLKPDIVFIVGDRYEVISAAIATSYMNIPLAHTMGGEITGTIDESVRHAITKLSHLHFVSNKDSLQRVIRLGELKKNVFNVGCPRIDLVKKSLNQKLNKKLQKYLNEHGVGDKIDLNKKFVLLSQHPVTTEYEKTKQHIQETISAINKINMQSIILWPNTDAGSDFISRTFRIWRENNKLKNSRFFRNIPSDLYSTLLNKCSCVIGNSSSSIREGAYIGVPAVNIGTRQNKRQRAKNVIDTEFDSAKIVSSIKKQLKNGKYKSSNLYGNGNSSEKILNILKNIGNIDIQKTNTF